MIINSFTDLCVCLLLCLVEATLVNYLFEVNKIKACVLSLSLKHIKSLYICCASQVEVRIQSSEALVNKNLSISKTLFTRENQFKTK